MAIQKWDGWHRQKGAIFRPFTCYLCFLCVQYQFPSSDTVRATYMSHPETIAKPLSRTQAALDWLEENPTQTMYAAAQRFGISQSALSQGKKRRHGLTPPLSRAKQADTDAAVSASTPQSKTQTVLAWLDAHPEETAYTAAHRFGIAQSVISRAKKARAVRAAITCPGCGKAVSDRLSRTQQALLWLKDRPQGTQTRKDAALEFGITASALYALGKKILDAEHCSQCGHVIKHSKIR